MTGKKPKELDITDPDDSIYYLLNHFYSLKRESGTKLNYSEMRNYSEVSCANLVSWEYKCIIDIDNIFEGSVHG